MPFAYWPPVYQRGIYVKADFDHPLRWKELSGEHDVFGDGRIVLFPTPGHTPGHQWILLRLDGGNIILIIDAHYLVEKMRQRLLTSVVWNPDAMVASWLRIEDLEERNDAELISTHDPEFATKVRLAPDAWYESSGGPTAIAPGRSRAPTPRPAPTAGRGRPGAGRRTSRRARTEGAPS